MSSTQLLTEKRELLDNLQVAWKSFRRLENVTESTGKRRRLERLQDRLAGMALQGLLASESADEPTYNNFGAANMAYLQAIEMLEARKRVISTEPDAAQKDVESPFEVFPKWYVPSDPRRDARGLKREATAMKRETSISGLLYDLPESTPVPFRWDGMCQMAVDDGRWIQVTEAEARAQITTRLVRDSAAAQSKYNRTVVAAAPQRGDVATPETS